MPVVIEQRLAQRFFLHEGLLSNQPFPACFLLPQHSPHPDTNCSGLSFPHLLKKKKGRGVGMRIKTRFSIRELLRMKSILSARCSGRFKRAKRGHITHARQCFPHSSLGSTPPGNGEDGAWSPHTLSAYSLPKPGLGEAPGGNKSSAAQP